jgi:hypothetical protein
MTSLSACFLLPCTSKFLTYSLIYFLFLFLVVLVFELWTSCLLGRYCTFEPLHQPFFVLGIVKIGSHETICPG